MRRRLPKGTIWKRGSTWWLRYHLRGRHYAESLHTKDAEEAQRLFREKMETVRADAIRGLHPAQALNGSGAGGIRLDGLWDAYLKSRSRPASGKGTLYMYQCQVGNFVTWAKDAHPEAPYLRDVTEEMADGFLDHLDGGKKASTGTYNKYLATLQRTFRYAMGNGGKVDTPWDHVRRRNGRQNRRRDFTVDEVVGLIGRASGWIRSLLIIGLYTGQRLRDCCMLGWEQVDFGADVVRVVPSKTRDSSGLRVELPMHADLRRHLHELHVKAGSPASGHVQPAVADRYRRLAPEVSRDIQEFIRCSGFQVHKDGTGVGNVRAVVQFGFHSLRHTFVSICLRSEKVNREVIRSIVGGSYLLYNHVDNGSKRTAVDLLPSLGRPKGKGVAKVLPDVAGMGDGQLRRMLRAVEAELGRRRGRPGRS